MIIFYLALAFALSIIKLANAKDRRNLKMRIDRIMFAVEQVRKGLSVTEIAERSGL